MIELKVTREQFVEIISGLEPKTLDECLKLDQKLGLYRDHSGFTWNQAALLALSDKQLNDLFYSLL